MGKWSQKQYDEVLVSKMMRLFENAMIYHGTGNTERIPDKRFKTFLKKLDPDCKVTQAAFRTLLLQGVFPPGHRSRAPAASTSLGPSGLPLPTSSEHMRIIYGGPPDPSFREGALEERYERYRNMQRARQRAERAREDRRDMEQGREIARLYERSPTPIPPRNVHASAIDFQTFPAQPPLPGHGQYNAQVLSPYPGPSSRPLFSDSSPPPPSLSYARARNQNRQTAGQSYGSLARGPTEPPGSPPNAASRAWLEEYGVSTAVSAAGAPPPNGMVDMRLRQMRAISEQYGLATRPVPQRTRRSQAPIEMLNQNQNQNQNRSDSGQSDAPDDFDNLLDQPQSSVIRPSRRRRREEDDDEPERERPSTRRRLFQGGQSPSPSWPDSETSWQDNHPWLAGLPMARSGATQGQDGRDTRRDGIVFDNSIMHQLTGTGYPDSRSVSEFGDDHHPFFDFEPDLFEGGEEVERLQSTRSIIASNGDTSVDGTAQNDILHSP